MVPRDPWAEDFFKRWREAPQIEFRLEDPERETEQETESFDSGGNIESIGEKKMKTLKDNPWWCAFKHVLTGIVGLSKWITGSEKASTVLQADRLNVCAGCRWQRRWLFGIRRCQVCGCFLVAKTSIVSTKCDIGKW